MQYFKNQSDEVYAYDDGVTPPDELNLTPITEEEAGVLEQSAQSAWLDSLDFARKRAAAYPSVYDQLDMIFHAGLGGDEFQAAIQAVKDQFPKE